MANITKARQKRAYCKKQFKLTGRDVTGAQNATIVVERRKDGVYASENSRSSTLTKVENDRFFDVCDVVAGDDITDVIRVTPDGTIQQGYDSRQYDDSCTQFEWTSSEKIGI